MIKHDRRALAYCRVSGETQRTDGTGLARQEANIRDYARHAGWDIVRVYREVYTGTKGFKKKNNEDEDNLDRPELKKLLSYGDTHDITVILIENSDRLARNLLINLQLIDDLKQTGRRLIDCDGNEITDDSRPEAVLFRQIKGAIDEYEKSKLVQRMWAGKKRTGRYGGRKRFGSKSKYEQNMLRYILKLRREQELPYREIAERASVKFDRDFTLHQIRRFCETNAK